MSATKEKIAEAYKWAAANRPKVNGYPYLAEALRLAGVTRYIYNLPSCQCIFFTNEACVASIGEALTTGLSEVPRFDKEAFLKILKTSQMGDSTFSEFLKGSWETGIVSYEADLLKRTVAYFSACGESYIEEYPAVEVRK